MKAGIVTFASAHNYGALLQAYAMQKYLEKNKVDASIINYRPSVIDNVYKIYKVKNSKIKVIKLYRKLKKRFDLHTKYRWKLDRYNNFEGFISNTLNTTKAYKTLRELQNNCLDYDLLIAGSDQIWNTDLTKGFSPAYFLEFGKKDAVRVSYAASLGREDIDSNYELFYRRYLKNFDYISVREKSMVSVFQNLTEKKIETVLDPTLLLDKSDYDELKQESKYRKDKYIYVHFIGKDEKLIEVADRVARDLGIKILHNFPNSLFDNELAYHYNESPKEIIDVIDNAEMVITNSFHMTVLSIIYNKKFITIPHSKRPERMINLLGMLNLSNHLVEDIRIMPALDTVLKADYKKVEELIKEERKKSIAFLNKAIKLEKPEVSTNYFKSNDKFECYGCGLCASICPVKAITMIEDEEGFVYPKIDEEKCINCGVCKRKCIYRNNKHLIKDEIEPEVYAVINKDKEIVESSTSGGVFTALYKKILEDDGYVVGVKYNENMEAVYDIADTCEGCKKFSGTKYVAASVGKIKEKVLEKLEKGNKVLFVGNPCQIVALKQFLAKDYNNLYLVEIICHGTPSPKIFRSYINYLEDKLDSKVVDFQCRNKKTGWQRSSVKVSFENGDEIYEAVKRNNYTRAFLNNYSTRPSCYNCEFTGNNLQSDMTIGDFWGIDNVMKEINDNTGVSLVKVNTDKGVDLFNSIKSQIDYYETNYEDGYRANHRFPCVWNEKRQTLMKEAITTQNINKLLGKYNQFKKKKK